MNLVDPDAVIRDIRRSAYPDSMTYTAAIGIAEGAINAVPKIPVVMCHECKHWDEDSGLSARMCYEFGHITTQYEFCSRGRKNGASGS